METLKADKMFTDIVSEWYEKKIFPRVEAINLKNKDKDNLILIDECNKLMKDIAVDSDEFIWKDYAIAGNTDSKSKTLLCVRDTVFDVRRTDTVITNDFKRLSTGLKVLQQLILGNSAFLMYRRQWDSWAINKPMNKESCIELLRESVYDFRSITKDKILNKISKNNWKLAALSESHIAMEASR